MASSPSPPIRDVDKLTNQIFSILENKFLFGHHHALADFAAPTGKTRILTIDAGGDGILAATTLFHLQTILRRKSGNPSAHISDFFDVVSGAGEGGILAALLFTRGKDGRSPLSTAEESLKFLIANQRELSRYPSSPGVFGRRKKSKALDRAFGDSTLRDTVKAVLIPCYDLKTSASFLFSRADAVEMEGCDFRMAGVCGATVASRAVELKSTDGKKRIAAVGGRVGGISNPTAAAITHVLNNKQEFPLCKGVEDLLVMSIGNGNVGNISSTDAFLKIAADGAADMVDQAVSMAFGECRSSSYIRIQGNGTLAGSGSEKKWKAEEMLVQKNVESMLFRGKKVVEFTNMEKVEMFAGELIKEQERRSSLNPQPSPSRRSSSATTISTLSSY